MAIEALKDITKEIHEIQLKNVKHKKNGYLTSTVGRLITSFIFLFVYYHILLSLQLSPGHGAGGRPGHRQPAGQCRHLRWDCPHLSGLHHRVHKVYILYSTSVHMYTCTHVHSPHLSGLHHRIHKVYILYSTSVHTAQHKCAHCTVQVHTLYTLYTVLTE